MATPLTKTPPPWLSKYGKGEWRRIFPLLKDVDTQALDLASVTAYCTCWGVWREAQEKLDAEGSIIATPKGQTQINPWHSILKQQTELLKKLIPELGLSVASRKKLDLGGKPAGPSLGDL